MTTDDTSTRHSTTGAEAEADADVEADADDRELLRSFKRFIDRAVATADAAAASARTPLGDRVSAFLGADATTLPVVSENIADHRLVDADLALDSIGADENVAEANGESGHAELHGVDGGQQRFHTSMPELVSSAHVRFDVGPVDYTSRATGPSTSRQVVSFGLRLLSFGDSRVAVIQRSANPQFGRDTAVLEVMGTTPEATALFLAEVKSRMITLSVLRGKVLSFEPSAFAGSAGVTFLPRPEVAADAIILPDGVLDSVADHVVGIGQHREALLRAGQHLKRGVLLFGPPGTGKTLTVRHLLTRTPGVTAVLLTGSSIANIGAAAEIARTFEPSIVVLEDIDLVAMQRHSSPQPLLFEVLDALDGLDGDADVAFVMTTNRVEVLERALAERPGRVDLAVEIALPGDDERRRLFRRYAGDLPFSDDALERAADLAQGVTGSFAKELIRRAVLRAAVRGDAGGDSVGDADLEAALDELLSARATLTRMLLGSGGEPSGRPAPVDDQADVSYVSSYGPVYGADGAHFYSSGSTAMGSSLTIDYDHDHDHDDDSADDEPR